MQGILFSLIAGVFICLQGVFNAKASEKLGLWQTNLIVHGFGFMISFLIFLIVRDGGFDKIKEVNKMYLIGGAFGVMIIFSVMKGITSLGASYAVTIILASQLLSAMFIDSYGLFGVDKIPLTTNKWVGILII
ncbi:MAG TPA: DMT family transporter, partial [Bacillota bacterium]|nr:DMT family transporter [Bacillota bacterium]